MEQSIVTTYILPAALALIMFAMGTGLVPLDFKRVLSQPKAAILGLLNQMVLLPLIAFGLVNVFGLNPTLAIGIMLIAACPGGVTSNLITYICRGDAALSITLTAINSVLSVLTIPLLLTWSMIHFSGEGATIPPPLDIIIQLGLVTILPVSLGMIVRRLNPSLAQKLERPGRIASSVIFGVIVAGLIAKNTAMIREHFASLAGVTISLNIITMALGFGLARMAKLPKAQRITVAIESGIQNGTLAILIALTILKRGDLAIPAGIYSIVMFITGAGLMLYFGRINPLPKENTLP